MSTFRDVRLSTFEKPRFGQSHNAKSALGAVTAAPAREPSAEPVSGPRSFKSSLVSTNNYRINMLLGKPRALEASHELGTRAQIDTETGFALLNTPQGSFVWQYTGPEQSSFALAFGSKLAGEQTTALFVEQTGRTSEPGLVVVNHHTGAVTLWDSVGRSIADGLFTQGNSIEHTVRLSSGEVIGYTGYVANVGLVVVTTAGRFYLVTLRSPHGKPDIAVSRMRSLRGGLLASLLSRGYTHDVVSVFGGAQINESERLVYTRNRAGQLSVWQCSPTGSSKFVGEIDLPPMLLQGVSLLYPNAQRSLQVHDAQILDGQLHVLASFVHDDRILWLVGFASIVGTDVVFASMHRLQSFVTSEPEEARLVIADRMVFACFDKAVVMLEREAQPQQPRFEDALFFKPGVAQLGADKSPAGLEVVTNVGVIEIHVSSQLTLPTAYSRLKTAIEQRNSTLPLDFDPHTVFGTLTEVKEAVGAIVKEIGKIEATGPGQSAKETLQLRSRTVTTLIEVVDSAPLPPNSDVPIDGDTRWWLAEEAAILAAAEAITDVTTTADAVKNVDNTPAVLISLLGASPELGFAGVSAAERALQAVGVPAKFPRLCPWPASRELVAALEAAARKVDVINAAAVDAICGAYSLRLGYLRDSNDLKEYDTLSRTATQYQKRLLQALSARDPAAATQIAEKYAIIVPLAQMLAHAWSSDEARQKADHYITTFGYEFAEALFSELQKTSDVRTVFKAFLQTHPEFLAQYVENHRLYRQGWVLAFFQGDLAKAASVLETAVKTTPSARERKIIASIQKLCAVQAGESHKVASADRELVLVAAQQELQQQYRHAAEFLATQHDGVNDLLSELLPKLTKGGLTTDETVDLLTFVSPRAPGSDANYARGFTLIESSPERASLLAQQTIINTKWSELTEVTLEDSLLYKTLALVPNANVKNYLLSPASWTAPTSAADIKHLYPWVTPSTLEKLHTDFSAFNATIERICREHDLMNWLQLISKRI